VGLQYGVMDRRGVTLERPNQAEERPRVIDRKSRAVAQAAVLAGPSGSSAAGSGWALLAQLCGLAWRSAERLSAYRFRAALSPASHTAFITAQRVTLLVSRIRFVAGAFALLTPMWSLIDILAFPARTWGTLIVGRLLASAAFAAIAGLTRDRGRLIDP
jgi:hypothetical protein